MKLLIHFGFFSKRNNKKNILSGRKVNTIIKKGILLLFIIIMPLGLSTYSQKKDASQRRAEKEKAQKEKVAKKKYDLAIKQHIKNQSATTRSMMKQTKKESPKNTPLKPSKGTKCKQH